MPTLSVAATQMACSWDIRANLESAENLIRESAAAGARVVLIQELFETPYFCIEQDAKHFELATSIAENPAIPRFRELAQELDVVLPCSWFERANRAFYNSVAMIDADGSLLGVYRKSHLPNGPGYQEKSYFNPGDTGFRVWSTRYGKIGVGICWDQWFPEAARSMALLGAELLLYPTAIGSEPPPAISLDSSGHWQRTMRGHAAANMIPVIASNRIGTEHATQDPSLEITFYGHSFISDHTGAIVAEADDRSKSILVHEFDMGSISNYRNAWGLYRDRRPDLYRPLATLDGIGQSV